MKKIIITGDSHSIWGYQNIPEFIRVDIPGVGTAYNLCNLDKNVHEELDKYPDLPIIFCLGEIDCRVYVHKIAREQNRTMCSVVKEIVDRYVEYLARLQRERKNWVYAINIVPAGDIDKLAEGFPITWDEFNAITLFYNKYLGEACARVGITFLDIYDQMIDENGRKKMDWREYFEEQKTLDWLHCNNKVGKAVLEKYFRD